MNVNTYTDKIVKIFKETAVKNPSTIWDILGNDNDFKRCKFNKSHIELINSIYIPDIQKMNQENLIELWNSTEASCNHATSHFCEVPEYDGDMISDIRDEILPLIAMDIEDFYGK